mgnify:CR=1 FL=1
MITYLDTLNDRDKNVRNLEKMIDSFKMTLGCNRNVELEFTENFSNDKNLQSYSYTNDFYLNEGGEHGNSGNTFNISTHEDLFTENDEIKADFRD